MNKTLSFARLDYITIKPYLTLKNLLLLAVVFSFIGFGTGSAPMIIGMLMMYGSIYVSYPFAVGDRNGIDALYAVLPVSKRHIVAGRYIFAVCLNIAAGIGSFAISWLVMFVFKKDFDIMEMLFTVLACLVLYTTVQAIQLPIFFKLGYTKGKMLSYLPLAMFPAAIVAASNFANKDKILPWLTGILERAAGNLALTAALVGVVWIAVFIASYFISYRVYMKREF